MAREAAPLGKVALDVVAEGFGGAFARLGVQPLLHVCRHVGLARHLVDGVVQFGHDVRRHAGRPDQAVVAVRVHAVKALEIGLGEAGAAGDTADFSPTAGGGFDSIPSVSM